MATDPPRPPRAPLRHVDTMPPNPLKRPLRHVDTLPTVRQRTSPSISYTPLRYTHADIPVMEAFFDDVLLRCRLAEVKFKIQI